MGRACTETKDAMAEKELPPDAPLRDAPSSRELAERRSDLERGIRRSTRHACCGFGRSTPQPLARSPASAEARAARRTGGIAGSSRRAPNLRQFAHVLSACAKN